MSSYFFSSFFFLLLCKIKSHHLKFRTPLRWSRCREWVWVYGLWFETFWEVLIYWSNVDYFFNIRGMTCHKGFWRVRCKLGEENRRRSLKIGKWIRNNVMEVEFLLDWWLEDDVEDVMDNRRSYFVCGKLELNSYSNVYKWLVMSWYEEC